MKKKHKQVIIFAIFVLICILAYGFCDRLLCYKTEHGVMQARELYAQPRDTVDVVFMGSSHIHCNVNTALLWEEYGIASYDYSAAEQPLWTTYYYLREVCKYQDPGLVVIDLYSPARFKDDYQYNYLEDNLLGVRFSLNKLAMIATSCEYERIWEYWPSISAYHLRFDSVDETDWDYVMKSRRERASYKGYTPYYVVDPQEEPELSQEHSGGITLKSEIYLQRIIDYCRRHDIDLFLMVSPYITTDEDELVYNRVHEIADMNGIQFNSTNYFYDAMNLDFESDFNDTSHLNYRGSCKFSEYLGGELKRMYEIPDRRGDERWESWDRHAQEIHEKAKEVGFTEDTYGKKQSDATVTEDADSQNSGMGVATETQNNEPETVKAVKTVKVGDDEVELQTSGLIKDENDIKVDDDTTATVEASVDTPVDLGRILFVGDSRTIDMFADSDETVWGQSHDDITVYAGHGMGFDFMQGAINDCGHENFDTLVTWMGANDRGDFSIYRSYYDELIGEGKTIIVCTVGPTQDDDLAEWDHPDYENSNMTKYNSELQKWASQNGVKVIDLYSYISSNVQIDPADGIHYTPRPTTSIWAYILEQLL